MTFVATIGHGTMDLYAQKLAEKLVVLLLYSRVNSDSAELFNIPWLSWRAVKSIRDDWSFSRTLNKLSGIVHLSNHHLGRYGNFLEVPYIITVHDLIRYFDLKGYGTYISPPNARDRFYLRLDYQGIKKACRIIASSQSTKKDLVHYLRIPDERISVVYSGIDHGLFRPLPHRNTFGYPYILFVGSEHPRKNLSTLLTAFRNFKGGKQFRDLKLVKVGRAGGPEADFRGQTMKVMAALDLHREVVFTEFVPEEELPVYYSNAECFVFPSLYEGFGLPPLEAMACGCPVVTSNTSSLPEVVGDAALTVDPYDVDALANAMREVLTNDELREAMIEKGLAQAKRFSWEKTVEETLAVYEKVEGLHGLAAIL